MGRRGVTLAEYEGEMTPDERASELNISPRRLRAWLRAHQARSPGEVGARWQLDGPAITSARAHFSSGAEAVGLGPAAAAPSSRRSRDDSDEAYVIDLLDEVLGERGHRQHRFPWLLGDPNADGRRVRLPVDAWCPNANLFGQRRP